MDKEEIQKLLEELSTWNGDFNILHNLNEETIRILYKKSVVAIIWYNTREAVTSMDYEKLALLVEKYKLKIDLE